MVDGVTVALQLFDLPVGLQFGASSFVTRRDSAADANVALFGLHERRSINLVGLIEGADGGDAILKHVGALLERILPRASLLLGLANEEAHIIVLRSRHVCLIAEALLDGFNLQFLLSGEALSRNITDGIMLEHVRGVAEVLQVSRGSEVEVSVLV